MRMLDNVIDINYYAVGKARNSNLKHRPVGLGIMGFQDCLHLMRVPYASDGGGRVRRPLDGGGLLLRLLGVDRTGRGARSLLELRRLLWDRGILPQDTLKLLAESAAATSRSTVGDDGLGRAARADRRHGMRNSNCVAIAPTATISNIIGVDASIEPTFQNLLRQEQPVGRVHGRQRAPGARPEAARPVGRGDGRRPQALRRQLAKIDRVPEAPAPALRHRLRGRAEVARRGAARRQKWIDQAQSLNIYMAGASGKKLDETYRLAWLRGLKTTYYLRTIGATHAEKSTGSRSGQLNAVPTGGGSAVLRRR
jgi:ribonucleoside-diphosphate reductase alpha chain